MDQKVKTKEREKERKGRESLELRAQELGHRALELGLGVLRESGQFLKSSG